MLNSRGLDKQRKLEAKSLEKTSHRILQMTVWTPSLALALVYSIPISPGHLVHKAFLWDSEALGHRVAIKLGPAITTPASGWSAYNSLSHHWISEGMCWWEFAGTGSFLFLQLFCFYHIHSLMLRDPCAMKSVCKISWWSWFCSFWWKLVFMAFPCSDPRGCEICGKTPFLHSFVWC